MKIEEVGGDKQQETSSIVFTPEGVETFNDPASAAGNLYISNGKLVYEMTKIGLTDWHNKMFVKSIELEADKIYTISFKAKADKNISCALFLNPLGKWDPRLVLRLISPLQSRNSHLQWIRLLQLRWNLNYYGNLVVQRMRL